MNKNGYPISAFLCATLVLFAVSKANISPIIYLLLPVSHASTDFLLTNANIYTVKAGDNRKQAMLVENGVITQIGSNEALLAETPEGIEQFDMGGKFVMPGFQDAHLHVAEAGFNEMMCLFSETNNTIASYKSEFDICVEESGEGAPWILGAGIAVAEMVVNDTNNTPRSFLDGLFGETPALVLDNLGHGAWANSKALQLAFPGIDLTNPVQPQGGVLLTDSSGAATGELFENAQQWLRDIAFAQADPDQSFGYNGLLKGLATVAKNGITTVSDAGGYWTRKDQLLWQRAEREGRMTARAFNALYVSPDRDPTEQIASLSALRDIKENQLANFNQVKIYVDGILSLGTAALKSNYLYTVVDALDYPQGFTYFKPDDLKRYAAELEAAGFQLHFHATGGRGVSLALDAIEHAKAMNSSTDQRHRITHLYIVDSADVGRFNTLGVVADFQLNPGSLDTRDYIPFLKEVLGTTRAGRLLSVKTLLDSGANVVLSSDYDAGPLSPLGTIKRALTRPDNLAQRVPDIATAIEMVTINVAHHFHQEAKTGSLEVGKYADFIVLDHDITTTPASDLDNVKVLSTVVGGKVVYDLGSLF